MTQRKYEIGQKVNDWEIIDFGIFHSRTMYECKCKCGFVTKKYSQQLTKSICCRWCSCENRVKKHIGKEFGNLIVIGVEKKENRTNLIVRCKNCSNEFIKKKSNCLYYNKFCKNCIDGYFPGKIVDGITLINRIGNGKWVLKCICGTIFESTLKKYGNRISSCGCRKRKQSIEKAKEKLGIKYKYLTVTRILGFKGKHLFLELKCVCGNTIQRPNGNEFKSESCGCKWHVNCPKGEKVSFCRFKSFEIKALREFYESKTYNIDELAEMYGTSNDYVRRIITRKCWKSI